MGNSEQEQTLIVCNNIRTKAIKKVIRIIALIIILISALLVYGLVIANEEYQMGILLGAGFFVLLFVIVIITWIPVIIKETKNEIKRIAVSSVLEKRIKDFKLEPKRKIGSRLFNKAQLFKRHSNLIDGGDLISGKRDDVVFALSDLRAFHKQGSGDSEVVKNVFKGLYMTILNKNHYTKTLITNKKKTVSTYMKCVCKSVIQLTFIFIPKTNMLL